MRSVATPHSLCCIQEAQALSVFILVSLNELAYSRRKLLVIELREVFFQVLLFDESQISQSGDLG